MSRPLPRSARYRRVLTLTTGTALALTGIAGVLVSSANANSQGSGLVINEVYGGGGVSAGTADATVAVTTS